MRVLSLFSGGGLGDYGLTLAGMEIVGQVEIDDYCQKILKLRWPDVPKWKDIREVKGEDVIKTCGRIDVVSGGFPCTPFSTAGRRKGKDDNRYLWPEMFRIICEIKPRWVLAENVPGLLSISDGRVFGDVVRDLASCGYGVEWDCIPASAVGANHRRDRVWILGYAEHFGRDAAEVCGSVKAGGHNGEKRTGEASESSGSSEQHEELANANGSGLLHGQTEIEPTKRRVDAQRELEPSGEDVADTRIEGLEGRKKTIRQEKGRECHTRYFGESSCGKWRNSQWAIEPCVGRVAHGVANRVDRLKCLGNGQVVQVVEWIGKRIMDYQSNSEAGVKKGELK